MLRTEAFLERVRFENRVLDAWPYNSGGDIARTERCTRNVIMGVVRRARETGDSRAIHKPDAPRKPGWWREGCPKTLAVAQAGAQISAARRSKLTRRAVA